MIWASRASRGRIPFMSTMTTMTIRLPEDLRAQAQELAQATGRTLDDVLAEAVAQGLSYDRWFRSEVEQGLRSTNSEQFASPEEVEEMWNRLTTPEAMA